MNVKDALLKSHQLKTSADVELLEPSNYVITIQDHYHKPRVSINKYIIDPGATNGSLMFELHATGLRLIDDSGFAGDKEEARKTLESVLECEIEAS